MLLFASFFRLVKSNAEKKKELAVEVSKKRERKKGCEWRERTLLYESEFSMFGSCASAKSERLLCFAV